MARLIIKIRLCVCPYSDSREFKMFAQKPFTLCSMNSDSDLMDDYV